MSTKKLLKQMFIAALIAGIPLGNFLFFLEKQNDLELTFTVLRWSLIANFVIISMLLITRRNKAKEEKNIEK